MASRPRVVKRHIDKLFEVLTHTTSKGTSISSTIILKLIRIVELVEKHRSRSLRSLVDLLRSFVIHYINNPTAEQRRHNYAESAIYLRGKVPAYLSCT